MQIAIYARVSTGRQVENELSIPDQLRQMRQWAERNGHAVVKEYVEAGATATNDKRPVFQDMMAEATIKHPAPFQMVVVHSFSRFFRDMIEATLYQKKLGKNGVKLVSITQHINDDPAGEMQQRIIMLFDEYQSKETAKHVLRSMQENARQGYSNGARAPFGYKTIEAGQTGSRGRIKKRLAIDEQEAETVREIFALYVHGHNAPRLGMKEIAKTLNGRGTLMRGKPWRVQAIHHILSETTCIGAHMFNKRDSKTFKVKDESEWVKATVPAIIDQALFDKATKLRQANTPAIRTVVDTLRKHANRHGGEEKLRLKKLEAELRDVAQAENKLFEAIEKGVVELDDRLKARIQQHKTRRDTLTAEIAILQPRHQTPLQTLTPQKIEAVARVLNRRLSETSPFSRAYLKLSLSEIRVNEDVLKLKGDNRVMANLIAADGVIDPNAIVPRFIPEWCARGDSNH